MTLGGDWISMFMGFAADNNVNVHDYINHVCRVRESGSDAEGGSDCRQSAPRQTLHRSGAGRAAQTGTIRAARFRENAWRTWGSRPALPPRGGIECEPQQRASVSLGVDSWHSYDCRTSPPVCRVWLSLLTAPGRSTRVSPPCVGVRHGTLRKAAKLRRWGGPPRARRRPTRTPPPRKK